MDKKPPNNGSINVQRDWKRHKGSRDCTKASVGATPAPMENHSLLKRCLTFFISYPISCCIQP